MPLPSRLLRLRWLFSSTLCGLRLAHACSLALTFSSSLARYSRKYVAAHGLHQDCRPSLYLGVTLCRPKDSMVLVWPHRRHNLVSISEDSTPETHKV
jgi:hypothetical protein